LIRRKRSFPENDLPGNFEIVLKEPGQEPEKVCHAIPGNGQTISGAKTLRPGRTAGRTASDYQKDEIPRLSAA
jgi:hypothetical protein